VFIIAALPTRLPAVVADIVATDPLHGVRMNPFKAFLIEDREGRTHAALVRMDPAQLDAGEVTVRVAYSSVNYKDALAVTGAGGLCLLAGFLLLGDIAGSFSIPHVIAARRGDFLRAEAIHR